ncbi:MAG: transposase zinc-binding domain-containing protein [Chitinophagaceae bacterium]
MHASPKYEVADVFRNLGKGRKMDLNVHQLKTIRAIKICRTKELGGHMNACTSCGTIHISYNS